MILDTSFIIDIMNNDQKAVDKLQELVKKGDPQLLTVLSIFELFSGIACCNKPAEEKNKILKILKGQLIVDFDNDSAEIAGEIDGNLVKECQTIGPIDSMIGGIALVKKQKVLTRNIKDFNKIKGLEVESY